MKSISAPRRRQGSRTCDNEGGFWPNSMTLLSWSRRVREGWARTARRDQYWVLPPPLEAPFALSSLIRCFSMLEELVAPL